TLADAGSSMTRRSTMRSSVALTNLFVNAFSPEFRSIRFRVPRPFKGLLACGRTVQNMPNGPLQPEALDAAVQRLADDRAEDVVEVERREVSQARQLVNRQWLGQVVLDVVDDPVDALAVDVGRLLRAHAHRLSGISRPNY